MTNLSKKHIPTLLGIGILVVSLVAGVLFIGTGGGVFAPRASASTTPKNMKHADVTDKSFTVSFVTDEATAGYVNYGTDPSSLKTRVGDDRDQLSGNIGQFTTHYITIRDLSPNTSYYFTVGTGSVPRFDNNGAPFTVITAQKTGTTASAKTVYGSVNTSTSNPASGAIVYIDAANMGEVSALVRDSGSWAIPLANARTNDGSSFATVTDTTPLTIFVQGTSATTTQTLTVNTKDAQPVKTITLGGTQTGVAQIQTSTSSATTCAQQPACAAPPAGCSYSGATSCTCGTLVCGNQIATAPANSKSSTHATPSPTIVSVAPTATPSASPVSNSGTLTYAFPSPSSLPDSFLSSPAPTSYTFQTPPPSPVTSVPASSPTPTPSVIVNTAIITRQMVNIAQPTIIGQVIPNTQVTIVIHSTTAITTQTTTDQNGNFAYDLSSQSKSLAPGKHTVTISYVDPTTGKLVSKTQTFTVAATTASTTASSAGPYSSSNPFPIMSPTDMPSPTDTSIPVAPVTQTGSSSAILPKTGHVSTTYMLVLGGLFFLLTGIGSWYVSRKAQEGQW